MLVATPALAQRDLSPLETCTVQVLNQTVFVRADGSWEIPNIPSNGGQVRARLSCTDGVSTRTGQSGYFQISPGRMNAIPLLAFADPDPGPTRIEGSAAKALLTAQGEVTALTITGVYPDGSARDITAAAKGTSYVSTNPAVASVTPSGLVAAGKSGTAVIAAWNEGVTVAVFVTVKIGDDTDGDGLPDQYEIDVGLDPGDPVDALVDQDADNLNAFKEFGLGTNPFKPDTDGDAIPDGEEIAAGEDGWITNPALRDTDGDLLSDSVEIATGTDPTDAKDYDFESALVGLETKPAAISLTYNPVVGEASVQLQVMGLVIDGSGVDLTAHKDTVYSTQNPATANFGATKGQVFAGLDGKTEVWVEVATHLVKVPVSVTSFAPQPLAKLTLGCYGNGVVVDGKRAFVACGQAGLVAVSLDPPNAPCKVATLDTAGNGNDVFLDGATAWLADGSNGLVSIDVTLLSKPATLATLDVGGDAWAVEGDGGTTLAVAAGDSGVRLVGGADPKAPVALGAAGIGGFARDVDLQGTLAAALRSDGRLVTIDVSNPLAPIVLSADLALNGARQVTLAQTLAIVAMGNSGLTVVDVSDPSQPAVLGKAGAGNFMLNDLDVHGTLVFGADYYRVNSVPIVQVAIPQKPLFAGVVEFSQLGDLNGIAVDVDAQLVAMIGGYAISSDKGITGSTDLFLGQHDELSDNAGIPPTCTIVLPENLSGLTSGAKTPLRVEAVDDVFVQDVRFFVDGVVAGTDSLAPYQIVAKLPFDLDNHEISAIAIDTGGNVGKCDPVTVKLIEDPLTTLAGRVVDGSGLPVSGADVFVLEESLAIDSGPDGTFSIGGVPTYADVRVAVQGVVGETILSDLFGPFAVVPAGLTDVGDLVLKTPVGSTTGVALVARVVPFIATQVSADGANLAGPLAARSITFFATNVDPGTGQNLAGPLAARSITFFATDVDPGTGQNLAGPLAARPVTFFATDVDPGTGADLAGPLTARPVTFFATGNDLGDGSALSGPLSASPVGFVDQPWILAIAPGSVSAADGTVTVTLTGVGFEDALDIRFYTGGAQSALLKATVINPDPTGAFMDVTFTIAGAAPKGQWVMAVETGTGVGPTAATIGNVFTVSP